MKSQEIRQSFIDFFVERDHLARPSSPLVPHGDATLLFTNAGMVQFKDYFLGVEKPEHNRAVTSQKCLRVSGKHNDLENVGPSPRHHTFFEMLGNFSFGDYFKAEAIEFGWDLVTRVWGLDPQHLFATVFEEDDEAFDLWTKISSLPPERVNRCGAKDNFWAMGDTGPCGPCSEIFVDRFPDLPKIEFFEGEGSGRYVEIWNLVFMQFERTADGAMTPLPNPSIDTGAGLERLAAVMQGAPSNYDTDLFQPLLLTTAEKAGKKYGADPEDPAAALDDTSMRVIADHIRAVTFLLADGVIPSNEGRGYVLRRVLRRAVRHGMNLGFEEPFLSSLVPVLGQVMGDAYPELGKTAAASMATIEAEEEKFLSTLARAAQKVQQSIETTRAAGGDVLDGSTLYHLYETYGLPVEVAQEIAEEEQFAVDHDGFEAAKKQAQELSRSASSMKGQGGVRALLFGDSDDDGAATGFSGYDLLQLGGAEVVALARRADNELEAVTKLTEGDSGVAVFDRTVFYAESGGQVGDRGSLLDSSGSLVAHVVDTQKEGGVYLHSVEIEQGALEVGDRIDLSVSEAHRRPTERHHTATHLLHASLRQHLGEGVRQAGSLVEPDRLRFDFTHGGPLDEEELGAIERTVNEWVRQAVPVEISEKSYDEAIDQGAMALFGEKYGDVVRTVEVPGFSLELCGGCHVANSGAVGEFVLTSERGVASGVRRIEALAGDRAESVRRSEHATLVAIEQSLGVAAERAVSEITSLRDTIKAQEKELSRLRMKLMSGDGGGENSGERTVKGIKVLTREVPPAPSGELRNLADVLRGKLGSGVVVLGTRADDKVNLVAAVSSDLTDRVDAGKIARRLGDVVGGSGGGRKDFAQAGGKDPDRLEDAFRAVDEAIQEMA